MLGDYSIMEWTTLGGIGTVIAAVLTVIRDNKSIKGKIEILSKELEMVSQRIDSNSKEQMTELRNSHENLMRENSLLSEGNVNIKSDTGYIRDEMLAEKMARLNLYNNVSNADEILQKLDFMRELVNQNGDLTLQVEHLEAENRSLIDAQNQETERLVNQISNFSSQLSSLEGYSETEEIKHVLKNILNELSSN